MANNTLETIIGAAVILVAGVFVAYASKNADYAPNRYPLTAKFLKADGITAGSEVRLSGVKVGTISSVDLDPLTYEAVLQMSIRKTVELPSDSTAKIASDGLLGGAYVAVEPGGSEYMLDPGAEIEHTQGSVNVLDLIGKAIYGGS